MSIIQYSHRPCRLAQSIDSNSQRGKCSGRDWGGARFSKRQSECGGSCLRPAGAGMTGLVGGPASGAGRPAGEGDVASGRARHPAVLSLPKLCVSQCRGPALGTVRYAATRRSRVSFETTCCGTAPTGPPCSALVVSGKPQRHRPSRGDRFVMNVPRESGNDPRTPGH